MLLDPQHSASKLYRGVDSISVWDQGMLTAPVHLTLIYPAWPCGPCFGKGAEGLQGA